MSSLSQLELQLVEHQHTKKFQLTISSFFEDWNHDGLGLKDIDHSIVDDRFQEGNSNQIEALEWTNSEIKFGF